jgi:hypothetical protein
MLHVLPKFTPLHVRRQTQTSVTACLSSSLTSRLLRLSQTRKSYRVASCISVPSLHAFPPHRNVDRRDPPLDEGAIVETTSNATLYHVSICFSPTAVQAMRSNSAIIGVLPV